MSKQLSKKQKGFTIIEVLIVLAIAGVIMLIVFLAVPALQRNSRNTQRRSDASHLSGLVNEYTANHAGQLPAAIGTGQAQLDLTNEKWGILTPPATANIISGTGTLGTTTQLDINTGTICDPTAGTISAGNARSFSITFSVETSSGSQTSCVGG